jgi:hypothetical protein
MTRPRIYPDEILTEAVNFAFQHSFRHASEKFGICAYTIYTYAVDRGLPIKQRWARSRRYSVEEIERAYALLQQNVPSRLIAETTGIPYAYVRQLKKKAVV